MRSPGQQALSPRKWIIPVCPHLRGDDLFTAAQNGGIPLLACLCKGVEFRNPLPVPLETIMRCLYSSPEAAVVSHGKAKCLRSFGGVEGGASQFCRHLFSRSTAIGVAHADGKTCKVCKCTFDRGFQHAHVDADWRLARPP